MSSQPPGDRQPAFAGRIKNIDILRGSALSGVLLINLLVISGTPSLAANTTTLNWLSGLVIRVLVEGKFYPLFAALFGWGLAHQLRAGRSLTALVKRMIILALIGLAHAVLLWPGDILLAYALIGLLVLALNRAPSRALLIAAGACFIAPSLLHLPEISALYAGWVATLRGWFIAPTALAGDIHSLIPPSTNQFDRYSVFLLDNLHDFTLKLAYLPFWAGDIAGPVLLGFAAGRSGWLERSGFWQPMDAPTRHYWKRIGITALLLGLALNSLYAALSTAPQLTPVTWRAMFVQLCRSTGGPLLSIAYAIWAVQSLSQRRWAGWLACLGQTTLTAYLMVSMAGVVLFEWLGVRAGLALVLALAGGIYLLQLALARYWMARHSGGPFEAAWRWLAQAGAR